MPVKRCAWTHDTPAPAVLSIIVHGFTHVPICATHARQYHHDQPYTDPWAADVWTKRMLDAAEAEQLLQAA